jgi:hypothetical protein
MVFVLLAHLIDVDYLREAYHRTCKDSALGSDGVTAKRYAEHLEENLRALPHAAHPPAIVMSEKFAATFGAELFLRFVLDF